MRTYIRYIGIIFLTVIMASCGSSGGGGGGGGDRTGNSGTSTLTVAIGNVSADSGILTWTEDIPSEVKSVMFTVMIQGSIQPRMVNVNGRSGISETFTGPNGTWDVRVIAYTQENAQGPPRYIGQEIRGVSGNTTIFVHMNPVEPDFRVFVSNISSDNVTAIDPLTFEKKTLVCIGDCADPRNLAANHVVPPVSVYVPFSRSDNAFDIDADNPDLSNEIYDLLDDFDNPYAVAFTCTGAEAWIVNQEGDGRGSISIADTTSGKVIITIRNADLHPSGESDCLAWPVSIAIAKGKAYIANSDRDRVCVVDTTTRTEITQIPTAQIPRYTAATPDGSFVYVSTSLGVQKIDTGSNTIKHTIPLLPNGGRNLGVAPDGSRIYAPNGTDQIMVIDVNPAPAPDTSFGFVTVDEAVSIFGVTVTSDGSLIFATEEEYNEIYAFGPGMIVGGLVKPMVIENSPGAISPRAITSSPGVKTEECQTQELCVPTLFNPDEGMILDNACSTQESPYTWEFSWDNNCPDANEYSIEVMKEINGESTLIHNTSTPSLLHSFSSYTVHSTSTPIMWRVGYFLDAIGEMIWSSFRSNEVQSEAEACVN